MLFTSALINCDWSGRDRSLSSTEKLSSHCAELVLELQANLCTLTEVRKERVLRCMLEKLPHHQGVVEEVGIDRIIALWDSRVWGFTENAKVTVDRKGRYIDVDLIHKETKRQITFVSTRQLPNDYNANNEFLLQLEKILDERKVDGIIVNGSFNMDFSELVDWMDGLELHPGVQNEVTTKQGERHDNILVSQSLQPGNLSTSFVTQSKLSHHPFCVSNEFESKTEELGQLNESSLDLEHVEEKIEIEKLNRHRVNDAPSESEEVLITEKSEESIEEVCNKTEPEGGESGTTEKKLHNEIEPQEPSDSLITLTPSSMLEVSLNSPSINTSANENNQEDSRVEGKTGDCDPVAHDYSHSSEQQKEESANITQLLSEILEQQRELRIPSVNNSANSPAIIAPAFPSSPNLHGIPGVIIPTQTTQTTRIGDTIITTTTTTSASTVVQDSRTVNRDNFLGRSNRTVTSKSAQSDSDGNTDEKTNRDDSMFKTSEASKDKEDPQMFVEPSNDVDSSENLEPLPDESNETIDPIDDCASKGDYGLETVGDPKEAGECEDQDLDTSFEYSRRELSRKELSRSESSVSRLPPEPPVTPNDSLERQITTMESSPNDVGIQEDCCQVLSEFICGNEKGSINSSRIIQRFFARNVHKLVLVAMENFQENMGIQIFGCKLLQGMASNEGFQKLLWSEAAGERIVDSLRKLPENPRLQAAGISALTSLVYSTGRQDDLISLGGINVVLSAMYEHRADIRVQLVCCKALETLSFQVRHHKDIIRSGAVDSILWALLTYKFDAALVEGVFKSLHSILYQSSLLLKTSKKARIGKYTLQSMKQHKNKSGVQEHGCKLLVCIMRRKDKYRRSMVKDGAVNVVLEAMQTHLFNARVQRMCCLCLLAFVEQNRDNKEFLEAEDGLNLGKVLLVSMEQHPYDELLQEYGCKLISRLLHEVDKELKTEFLKATVIAMDNHVEDERIQEIGCKILGITKNFAIDAGVYEIVEEALATARSIHPKDDRIQHLVSRFLS